MGTIHFKDYDCIVSYNKSYNWITCLITLSYAEDMPAKELMFKHALEVYCCVCCGLGCLLLLQTTIVVHR